MLFELGMRRGATEAELAAALEVSPEAAAARLDRLIGRDLVARRAVGAELAPGVALTERGERIRTLLADNWTELENALFGEGSGGFLLSGEGSAAAGPFGAYYSSDLLQMLSDARAKDGAKDGVGGLF